MCSAIGPEPKHGQSLKVYLVTVMWDILLQQPGHLNACRCWNCNTLGHADSVASCSIF